MNCPICHLPLIQYPYYNHSYCEQKPQHFKLWSNSSSIKYEIFFKFNNQDWMFSSHNNVNLHISISNIFIIKDFNREYFDDCLPIPDYLLSIYKFKSIIQTTFIPINQISIPYIHRLLQLHSFA